MLCTCDPVHRTPDFIRNRPSSKNKEKFTKIEVKNPITQNSLDQGRFTTYEINLDTNDIAFTLHHTIVRRRFSEFEWLLRQLKSNHRAVCPELPTKLWFSLSGRFDPDVIEKRRRHFETILKQIVEEAVFLSDPALHLFLQTQLSVKEMEKLVAVTSETSPVDVILTQADKHGSPNKPCLDRTKTGSLPSKVGRQSGTVDDMGIVIHLADHDTDHVTTRVSDFPITRVSDDRLRTSCSESNLRLYGSVSPGGSDYLSSSASSRRSSRRSSFQRDITIAELIEHLDDD